MSAADGRAQARMLVRLRHVRMEAAARALEEARAAAARAEAERARADAAAAAADERHRAACEDLTLDPGEAERLLAVADHQRFRQSVARSALGDARERERQCGEAERERRRLMILARARHDRIAEHADALARRWARRDEERTAWEIDEARRPR
ncbi:hypothetical protein [Sphingomonas lenta]|uniref:Uncharacterized protein n=1 Tax=Sphingomonas lenta TaxID=1141887 RepID=A0A2A2SCK5_9SPHN|nr:hypothetical protein [Sphingomonas lenta]PAX06989.1 hypothetical protein CKY28_13065 [Sphingomonas lenta]